MEPARRVVEGPYALGGGSASTGNELMKTFLLSLGFLTRFPVTCLAEGPERLGRATAFFPIVGGLIGLLLAGVNVCAALLWQNEAVANALVIVALTLVTGGLHLDGLMDICDGVFGGHNRERALEIMKDSRVGAFGVLGAVCLLLLKFSFLFAVPAEIKWRALVFMPVAGRWAFVYAIAAFPYARPEGTGKAFKEQVGRRQLFWASVLAVAIGASLFRLWLPLLALFILAAAHLLGRYLTGKLGGLTGDAYGAIGEVVELLALAAIPLLARIPLV